MPRGDGAGAGDAVSRVVLAILVLLLCACSSAPPVQGTDAGHDSAVVDSTAKDTGTGPCTPLTWYPDVDRDGYGAAYPTGAGTLTACTTPAQGWVADNTDCADQDTAKWVWALIAQTCL